MKYYTNKVLVNKARCKLCGDVVESKHGHDYRSCKCGEIAVDGGLNYIRRTANNLDSIEELSETIQIEREPYEWEK